MKHLIITGLLALTLLTSCHWFGDDEPITHEQTIRQMFTDSLTMFEDNQPDGVLYYNPDGTYAASYETFTEEWDEPDGEFTTEWQLELGTDSLVNHYWIRWDTHKYYRIPAPYSVIDSVKTGWWAYQRGRPGEEGEIIDDLPTLHIIHVYLNTEYPLRRIDYAEKMVGKLSKDRSLSVMW